LAVLPLVIISTYILLGSRFSNIEQTARSAKDTAEQVKNDLYYIKRDLQFAESAASRAEDLAKQADDTADSAARKAIEAEIDAEYARKTVDMMILLRR
jgi:hypothetical protein